MFSGQDLKILGGVSTSTGLETPADPPPAAGPGWQLGPGAVASGRDMEIGGDVQTRPGSTGGPSGS
ncbi:hypothetical protein FRACA_380040 [Frankia canadensis]|uniref:Uncharacterized protein n=1 Tax=Frankia canadensis TaxID=1836972 RepID=A0A2I2KW10_9ACTN|nr:hypothetical protein [Frankia canadensis]SNQ49849.1 hypothetical protein FRACA_380040 [Frankia canadensis]SOU57139.1 hypothetical protein FRACA_380040 [Frankia canadensis]